MKSEPNPFVAFISLTAACWIAAGVHETFFSPAFDWIFGGLRNEFEVYLKGLIASALSASGLVKFATYVLVGFAYSGLLGIVSAFVYAMATSAIEASVVGQPGEKGAAARAIFFYLPFLIGFVLIHILIAFRVGILILDAFFV